MCVECTFRTFRIPKFRIPHSFYFYRLKQDFQTMSTRSLVTFSLLVLAFTLNAQGGIDFYHGTWAEAKARAKAEDKLIFVDAYAEWCGPCKRMAAQTFPDPKAGEFFNANFVCLKVDMEKADNQEFATTFPVSAYPTLMFIDGDGKLTVKQTGALDVDGLLSFGRKALAKANKWPELEAQYNEGKRDPEFLLQYVRALNRADKPSLKITNDYLNTQSDFTMPFNLKFILEGATEADSRVFDLLVKNRVAIEKEASADAVNKKIEKACQATVRKAVEFKDKKLLADAKKKMKQNYPARAAAFGQEADLKFAAATHDSKGYLKAMKARQKEVGNSAARLHDLVIDMQRAFPDDPKVLKQAQKWAETAAEKGGLPEYYLTLAGIYKRLGKKDEARKAAEQARKALGETDPQGFGPKIDYFLREL